MQTGNPLSGHLPPPLQPAAAPIRHVVIITVVRPAGRVVLCTAPQSLQPPADPPRLLLRMHGGGGLRQSVVEPLWHDNKGSGHLTGPGRSLMGKKSAAPALLIKIPQDKLRGKLEIDKQVHIRKKNDFWRHDGELSISFDSSPAQIFF